jgi:hypothetical protein
VPLDHVPITIENFGGLYRRGFDDDTPQDHFCDGLNFQFTGSVVGTRFGSRKDVIISNVKRYAVYRRAGEATRLLILTYVAGVGKIFDSTSLGAAILTINGMTDFSVVNFYNRAYITPHNGITGLPGEKVYVYNGTGTARAAAGAAPVGALTLATSGVAGGVERGSHLISVCYETDTGYLTYPLLPKLYVAPGAFKLAIANIPTGPGYVSARRLLASQVISYNGNPLGFAMFFVPGGRIADNVTTNLTLDFFDVQLADSADYLFDQLAEIPAGIHITSFSNRMIVGGENANPSLERVSKAIEPESFSASGGFIVVSPATVGGVKGAIEYRKQLFITKATGMFVTEDSGGEPDTWDAPAIDKGIGSNSPFGLSQIFDDEGANLDIFFIASLAGLYGFNGAYIKPEMTFKVEEIWKRINKNAFNLVQVWNDVQARMIYVSVPLDGAVNCSHVLVGDYVQGLNYQDIRWSLFQFPWSVLSIGVAINPDTGSSYFQVAGGSNIYSLIDNTMNDDGTAINCFIRFWSAFLKPFQGWTQHFTQAIFRVWGVGTLLVTLQSEDNSLIQNGENVILANPAGAEPNSRFNFQNEKCSLKIQLNNGTNWFKLKHVLLYAKALWQNRPQ